MYGTIVSHKLSATEATAWTMSHSNTCRIPAIGSMRRDTFENQQRNYKVRIYKIKLSRIFAVFPASDACLLFVFFSVFATEYNRSDCLRVTTAVCHSTKRLAHRCQLLLPHTRIIRVLHYIEHVFSGIKPKDADMYYTITCACLGARTGIAFRTFTFMQCTTHEKQYFC